MRMALLRWFVALALVANLGYAAWSLGWLAPFGLAPATQREPGRLARQLNPSAVRILSPAAAAAALAEAAASSPTVGPQVPLAPAVAASAAPGAASTPNAVASAPLAASTASQAAEGDTLACLEIGPLDGDTVVQSVERTLASVLPARDWSREARRGGAQYAVFVGPINSRESARTRREELTKLKLSFEAIELPGGRAGGYSLGLHDSEASAQAALERFRERGLRNADVVLARAGGPRTWLRMDSLLPPQAAAVRALDASLLGGVTPADCAVDSVMAVGAPR
jgi:hypothetical protein